MTEMNIFEGVFDDLYRPTPEEEREYWSGVGIIKFFVQQNIDNVFEIEIEESTGCAGGAGEMLGLEWLIRCELGIDRDQLKQGHTYTIEGLTVQWFRGDGWTTDDDVEYSFESLKDEIEWFRFMKQKLINIWWQNIGWRIRNARHQH